MAHRHSAAKANHGTLLNNIIIQAEGLSKQIASPEGLLTILDDISFSMRRSETLAVVGASGSGKSTLLGLLAGLDTPTEGRVVLDGTDLNTLDEDGRSRWRAHRVGFVFQAFHLLPSLTALENVMLPLELALQRDPAVSARSALDRVGLGQRLGHYPHQLSGGEQQRVAIARAFAPRPRILFADEPTGNLDRKTGAAVGNLLFALREEAGTTLVLVTHEETLANHCEQRLTLEMGRLSACE
ncbi:MAG: ABC transporter ATP-binding protein [Gammaproteobacteria bacterium]